MANFCSFYDFFMTDGDAGVESRAGKNFVFPDSIQIAPAGR